MRTPKYRRAQVHEHLTRFVAFQIRALLKARGWSNAELARRSGLNSYTIEQAVDGVRLSVNTIECIAAAFDVACIFQFATFDELDKWNQRLPELEPPAPAEDGE
jgi:transcriptional regulator with XRE-family HTH domain